MPATLDLTSRRLRFPKSEIVLTDTVGFIRDLPGDLLKAFQIDTEEIAEADFGWIHGGCFRSRCAGCAD